MFYILVLDFEEEAGQVIQEFDADLEVVHLVGLETQKLGKEDAADLYFDEFHSHEEGYDLTVRGGRCLFPELS